MPTKPPIISLALALLLAPAAAGAVESGPYGSLSAGAAFLTDSDLEEDGLNAEAEFDLGVGVTGAAGYASGNGLRTELELSWRRNGLDGIEFEGLSLDVDGRARALAAMANVAYDFDVFEPPVYPYVMAGVGVANVDLEIEFDDIDEEEQGDDTVFAYQAGAGLNADILPNLTVFGGYRFFATADAEIGGTDVEYRFHNMEAGVRYHF